MCFFFIKNVKIMEKKVLHKKNTKILINKIRHASSEISSRTPGKGFVVIDQLLNEKSMFKKVCRNSITSTFMSCPLYNYHGL